MPIHSYVAITEDKILKIIIDIKPSNLLTKSYDKRLKAFLILLKNTYSAGLQLLQKNKDCGPRKPKPKEDSLL